MGDNVKIPSRNANFSLPYIIHTPFHYPLYNHLLTYSRTWLSRNAQNQTESAVVKDIHTIHRAEPEKASLEFVWNLGEYPPGRHWKLIY